MSKSINNKLGWIVVFTLVIGTLLLGLVVPFLVYLFVIAVVTFTVGYLVSILE